MSDPTSIRKAVEDGCRQLRAAVQNVYWPPHNDRAEFSERHISFYVGRALAGRGYRIFLECRFPTGNDRLDMLAINVDRREMIAIEAKRLYSAAGAKSISTDIARMRGFTILRDRKWYYAEAYPSKRYGLILATTWDEIHAAWWADRAPTATPKGTANAGWKTLGRQLKKALDVGRVRLTVNDDRTKRRRQQYALWALLRY
jgi:hypothetical protein